MMLLRYVLVTAFIAGSVPVNALEATATRDVRTDTAPFELKLSSVQAAVTSAYNGLAARVTALESKVGGFDARITVVENALNALKADYNAFKAWSTAQINSLASRLSNVESRVGTLEGKSKPAISAFQTAAIQCNGCKGKYANGAYVDAEYCALADETYSFGSA